MILARSFVGISTAAWLCPEHLWVAPLVFAYSAYYLFNLYVIDLPRDKSILAFFEQNHPEMCSWLEESAVLEAAVAYGQKQL